MILIISFVVVVYGKLQVVRNGLLEFGNKIVSSSFSSELADKSQKVNYISLVYLRKIQ